MSKIKGLFALLITALPLSAAMADEVEFNGQLYSCTNRCQITVSGNYYTIKDCCGGRVQFVIR